MKRKQFFAGMVVLLAITHISCDGVVVGKEENPFSKFKENPVTVTWHGDTTQGIQSYQARVETYTMNNRKEADATLRSEHRIAVKIIGEKVYTRIDFDGDSLTAARTVISDGSELVIFDPITENIDLRVPLDTTESPLLRLFSQETGISRINLSLIREEAKRLSLDITEESSKRLLIDLPNNLFPQIQDENVTRRRDGQELVAEIRYKKVFGISIPYPWVGYKDKYKTVNYSDPTYIFPSDLPVGFIVGTKNSFRDQIPNNVIKNFQDLKKDFDTARTVHLVKSALIYGLLLGCPVYASNAGKASSLVGDIDGMVNYITRSYEGDGLVARANQYYPKTAYNPYDGTTKKLLTNVLEVAGQQGKGFAAVDANHEAIIKEEQTNNYTKEMVDKARYIQR